VAVLAYFLPNRFVVVQNANLLPDELDNPEREGIRTLGRAANVRISANRQQRITRNNANAVPASAQP
jgi:hypothetical protein